MADSDGEDASEIEIDETGSVEADVRPQQVEDDKRQDGSVERYVTRHIQRHRVYEFVDGHWGRER